MTHDNMTAYGRSMTDDDNYDRQGYEDNDDNAGIDCHCSRLDALSLHWQWYHKGRYDRWQL